MSPQIVQTTERSSARGLSLVTVLHATVNSIALNGPPLDVMTQLCSVVAHVDFNIAEQIARESMRSIFRAAQVTPVVQQQAA